MCDASDQNQGTWSLTSFFNKITKKKDNEIKKNGK